MRYVYAIIPKKGDYFDKFDKIDCNSELKQFQMSGKLFCFRFFNIYSKNMQTSFIIVRSRSQINNKKFWEKKKLAELLDIIREIFTESELLEKNSDQFQIVFAIHWGGLDTFDDNDELVKKITNNDYLIEGTNARLTFYSENSDKENMKDLLSFVEKINQRIGLKKELSKNGDFIVDPSITESAIKDKITDIYHIKETILFQLYPVALGMALNKNIKNIVSECEAKLSKDEYKDYFPLIESITQDISSFLKTSDMIVLNNIRNNFDLFLKKFLIDHPHLKKIYE